MTSTLILRRDTETKIKEREERKKRQTCWGHCCFKAVQNYWKHSGGCGGPRPIQRSLHHLTPPPLSPYTSSSQTAPRLSPPTPHTLRTSPPHCYVTFVTVSFILRLFYQLRNSQLPVTLTQTTWKLVISLTMSRSPTGCRGSWLNDVIRSFLPSFCFPACLSAFCTECLFARLKMAANSSQGNTSPYSCLRKEEKVALPPMEYRLPSS